MISGESGRRGEGSDESCLHDRRSRWRAVEEENERLREEVKELSMSLAERERRIAQGSENYACLQALFDEQQEDRRRKEKETQDQMEQLMREIAEQHGKRDRREQEHAAQCSLLEQRVLETRRLIDENMDDKLHACELLAQLVAMIPMELKEEEEVQMRQPPASRQEALKRTISSASTSFRILERKLSIPSPGPTFSRTMSSLPVSRPPIDSPKSVGPSKSPRVLQGTAPLLRTTSMVLPTRTRETMVEESAQSSFLRRMSPAMLKEALAIARKGLSSAQQNREIVAAQESLRMQNMMLRWQEEKQQLQEMVKNPRLSSLLPTTSSSPLPPGVSLLHQNLFALQLPCPPRHPPPFPRSLRVIFSLSACRPPSSSPPVVLLTCL